MENITISMRFLVDSEELESPTFRTSSGSSTSCANCPYQICVYYFTLYTIHCQAAQNVINVKNYG